MVLNEEIKKELALRLYEVNAFKFGDFKMKVGINSPVYFDLRVIVSHPDIMESLSVLLLEFIKEEKVVSDHFCGVPYTALPIATLLSVKAMQPMLIRRKEAKGYGTKKLIEGKFKTGDRCLIIEDVVTSGSSILETVNDLRGEGIIVNNAIVVVNREQGGVANINDKNVKMHSLFTLSYLLNVLRDAGKIEDSTVTAVAKYIAGCQIKGDGSFVDNSVKIVNELDRAKMNFTARSNLAKCSIGKTLFKIMTIKKTNLCVAADFIKTDDILNIAETIGPYICILKTHIDIVEDFNENFIKSLKLIAKKHNFLLMEDRKFADIGNTVSLQYGKGIFKISEWADLVTAHSLAGPSLLQALKSSISVTENRGVFLLAELSGKGNLLSPQYTEATIKMATEASDTDIIAGIVAQNSIATSPGLIQLTPGVKIEEGNDNLGQQYNTPEYVVKEKGADIAVVGRGIINAKCPIEAAKLYRDRLWRAYCERVGIDID